MHFNYYFLKFLSASIFQKIDGTKLKECFSQNKDELVLTFEDQESTFTIKSSFTPELSLLTFPEAFHRAKRNSVDLFPEIKYRKVKGVHQYENERSFSILFEDNFNLLFKLHGGRANICLFRNNEFISMFKNNFPKDKNIALDELNRYINHSDDYIVQKGFDLDHLYPTFDKKIKNYLNDRNFEFLEKHQKLEMLKKLIQKLESGNFFIEIPDKGRPILNLIPNNNHIHQTSNPLDACNQLATQYYQVYLLKKEKESILRDVAKQKTKTEAYLKKLTKKLDDIINGIKNDELANILMANLHQKPLSDGSIKLFDFYRNENIVIKLKKGLSLQANASILYKKAKNQEIEIRNIKENIKIRENKIHNLNMLIESVSSIQNLKSLRKLALQKSETPTNRSIQVPKPYIEYTIDNHTVLVGKNAKSNDTLLRQFTSKEDIWLHARDVGGSHVIIKKPSQNISMMTIEKVAQLAAWYSKGKNDTLCPVIHTKRKYVNKPKGAEPGKVTVQREEVILVNPCQNPQ